MSLILDLLQLQAHPHPCPDKFAMEYQCMPMQQYYSLKEAVPVQHPIPVICLFSGFSHNLQTPNCTEVHHCPRSHLHAVQRESIKRTNLLAILSPQQISALWIHFWKCDARTPINSTCEVNQGDETALYFSSSLNKRHEHLPFRMVRKQTSRCKQVQAQLSTDLKNYSSCLIVTNCWSVNCGAGQAGHWLLLLSYSTTIHAIHVTHTHRKAFLTENWKWQVWMPEFAFHHIFSICVTNVEQSSHLSAV